MILSLVIPTMNKVDLLRRTLTAVRGQIMPENSVWEVVVVNDGSTDGTADYLAQQDAAQWESPTLKVVSPDQNVGRARARNLGARAASGEYILFIDDDIVATPDLVSAHLNLLQNNHNCGTIGYAVTEPGLIDGAHFHYLDSRGVAKLVSNEAPGRFFVTQNAAVPRQAFLDIGGFDESFAAYGFEDMEVAFRLEDTAHLSFLTLAQPVPLHVHHHTLDQYWEKKRECGRNSLAMIANLHPGRVKEMNLHHVVDYAGQSDVTPLGKFIRYFAESALGRGFPELLGKWPTGKNYRPVLPAVYFSLMNLAVLCCFRQGLTEKP